MSNQKHEDDEQAKLANKHTLHDLAEALRELNEIQRRNANNKDEETKNRRAFGSSGKYLTYEEARADFHKWLEQVKREGKEHEVEAK